jgi:Ca2+:H+ antiporter
MYIQLLVFQLYTHKDIFDEDELTQQKSHDGAEEEDGAEDGEEPSISMNVALLGLGIATLSVTLFSDLLVSSIDEFCEISGISRTFVGIIIIPIVGNAVEHITAVTVAMKNKMDLSMGGTFFQDSIGRRCTRHKLGTQLHPSALCVFAVS